jgi:gluconolactonase
MKKTLFIFLGVLCAFGFSSCAKNFGKKTDRDDLAGLANNTLAELKGGPDCGCAPVEGSTIFDLTCLVSPGAHGRLDTLGTGFSFTEGPAVDKNGNIFFTDQPNDKIHKWSANTAAITTFLTGTGRSNGMAFDK